jgi:hypothetical protein
MSDYYFSKMRINLNLFINFSTLECDKNCLEEAIALLEENSNNKHMVQGLDSILALIDQIQEQAALVIGDDNVYGETDELSI